MRWRIPFGVVSIGVGVFFLYAAWANFRLGVTSTACQVTPSPGVHFTTDWALQYYNQCGARYDYSWLYLHGFTVIGAVLIGGGSTTVRDTVR